MNNIEKQVNEDLDDLIGHSFLKKIDKENFDNNEPKHNKKAILIKVIAVIVPILILGLYFAVGRDFSNNTYTTEERQYAVYQLASKAGYKGTFEEWLESIQGDSIELRVVGTEVQWKPSAASDDEWKKLYDMQDFSGEDGLSALEIWQEIEGNSDKSEEEFFKSLSAYGIWLLQEGNAGKSEEEFLESLKGEDGVDTSNALYVLYKSLGYNKSFEEWKKEYVDSDGNFELDLIKKEFTITFGNTGITTKVKDGELITDNIPNVGTDGAPEFMTHDGGWLLDDFKWNFKTTVVKSDLTLQPSFENIVYEIKYSVSNGATHSNPTTITKDDVIDLTAAVLEGKTFGRWYSSLSKPTTGNYTVTKIDGSNLGYYLDGKDEILLVAAFADAEFNINYELNGGINNVDNVNKLKYGSSLTLSNPTKENYDFIGWYDESGNKVQTITNISSSINLEARWSATEYNVTYELNDGTNNVLNKNKVTIEDFIYLYEANRTGHKFEGWYDEDGNKLIYLINITSDITLEARWSVNSYIISYNLAGGFNNGNPIIVTYEDVIQLTAPERAGYNFDGWYNGDTKVETLENVSSNMLLVARWTARNLLVVFVNELNPSNTNPSLSVTCETANIKLSTLTEEGYTFLGWYNGLGNKVSELSYITENVQLYARWQIIQYNINYDLSGGKQIHYNPEKLTVEESITLNDAYKEHFTFIGWFENDQQITQIINPTRDYNLEARYEAINYNIYYELNGGINSQLNKTSLTYNDNFNLYNPSKDGYEFGGWYSSPNFYGNSIKSVSISNLMNNEVVLYAKWNFTISTDSNNVQYFYYGTYPQSEVAGVTGGTVSGEVIYFEGEKYTYYNSKYYKHEAIRWNIIKNDAGVMSVYSNSVLDADVFSDTLVSNFEQSSLYIFLNTIFTHAAFHSAGTEIDVKTVYLPTSSQVLTNYTTGIATDYAVAKSDNILNSSGSAQWWINDIPSHGKAKFCVNSSVGSSEVTQTSKLGVRPHLIVTM